MVKSDDTKDERRADLVAKLELIQSMSGPRKWSLSDTPPPGMGLLFEPEGASGGFVGKVMPVTGTALSEEQRRALH